MCSHMHTQNGHDECMHAHMIPSCTYNELQEHAKMCSNTSTKTGKHACTILNTEFNIWIQLVFANVLESRNSIIISSKNKGQFLVTKTEQKCNFCSSRELHGASLRSFKEIYPKTTQNPTYKNTNSVTNLFVELITAGTLTIITWSTAFLKGYQYILLFNQTFL